VIAGGRRVLEAAGRLFGFGFEWQKVLIGGVAIDAYGMPLRDRGHGRVRRRGRRLLRRDRRSRYDDPKAKVRPEQALLALRKGLGLYANLRPVTVQPVLRGSSPVRESLLEGVDMLIVRELTGGLYFGKPSGQSDGPNGREVVDTLFYTEGEIRPRREAGLRAGPRAPQEADQRRQGKRAVVLPAVATIVEKSSPSTPTSRSSTGWWTPAP